MTQLQTLQDIYGKISDIYDKFCDFDIRLTDVQTKTTKTYDKLISIESDIATIKTYVTANLSGTFEWTSCDDENEDSNSDLPVVVTILIDALVSNLVGLVVSAELGGLRISPLVTAIISTVADVVKNAIGDYIKDLIKQVNKPVPKINSVAYGGQGLYAISGQINLLAKHLDKMTQLLCPDLSVSIASVECKQDATGGFGLTPSIKLIKGRGLEILSPIAEQLSAQQSAIAKSICLISNAQTESVPLFIGEKFEALPVTSQLVLRFIWKDATTRAEKILSWYVSIPDPIPCDQIDWCKHFDGMERNIGNVFASVQFGTHKNKSQCYFQKEEEAIDFMVKYIIPLSQTKPVLGNDGQPVRIVKNGTPKRKPRNRILKCASATWVDIDPNTGEPKTTWTFKPLVKKC
jgi:hypothetical protein